MPPQSHTTATDKRYELYCDCFSEALVRRLADNQACADQTHTSQNRARQNRVGQTRSSETRANQASQARDRRLSSSKPLARKSKVRHRPRSTTEQGTAPDSSLHRSSVGNALFDGISKEANAQGASDDDDLSEFIEFLAKTSWDALPARIQSMTESTAGLYDEEIEALIDNVPNEVRESLDAYALLPPHEVSPVLHESLTMYLAAVKAELAAAADDASQSSSVAVSRPTACEICDRDWIPLTSHHLIPRAVHDKALKRHWHEPADLQRRAWICRACHSFVHRIASNEELARHLNTIEALLDRDDVQAWATWVSRVRWKAR